jgi:hypothetical protein
MASFLQKEIRSPPEKQVWYRYGSVSITRDLTKS